MANDKRICSVDGCNKPVLSRGWCSMHYGRWLHNGDPMVVRKKWSDLTGMRFGLLTAIEPVEGTSQGIRWRCQCDCGNTAYVVGKKLNNGHTKSCGCYQPGRTHGKTGSGEHGVWAGMKQRCYNPSTIMYHRYGGRGIRVCERWRNDFAAFLADMGPRPSPKHTIDRIDNDRDYEPGNCRWATKVEQDNNRSTNRIIELEGVRGSIAEVYRTLLPPARYKLARHRIWRGWEPKDAFYVPARSKRALEIDRQLRSAE